MSGERFTLDTNILVYSVDRQSERRHAQAIDLVEQMSRCDCVLTLQALCEFYNAVTRKGKMPQSEARAQVHDWMVLFPVVNAEPGTLQRAMRTREDHGFPFWDAMLLETAAQAGVTQFLSEDLQHGRIWKGLTIRNPFEPA